MLILGGLGVNFDPTLSLLNEVKEAEEVFLEIYTTPLGEEIKEKAEKIMGKKIKMIKREQMEGEHLLELAKKKRIVVLVGGDPFSATTHASLILEARKQNIPYKVIHNSSIFTAAPAKVGLELYKFGRTVTIPYWREEYQPTSPLHYILQNIEQGLHTLILLDVDEVFGPMDLPKAFSIIQKMEEKEGRKLPNKFIVISRLGFEDEKIIYGEREKLVRTDLKPPITLILPGTLNVIEKEWLEMAKV